MNAGDVVRDFLAAMEARDLDRARSHLGEGFAMVFPGNVHLGSLDELIAWAKPRYQRVGKTFTRLDVAPAEDGEVVTVSGTLHGVWPDGAPFDGIRYVDVFRLVSGKIVEQHVWNDLEIARTERASPGAG
ncbi:MAG: nuclear transport factor 2 family protein [Devosia sp.]